MSLKPFFSLTPGSINKQLDYFKKNKSTATAGILLQSLIAKATDLNQYALMASLDLSAAFDLVNVGLLVKRLNSFIHSL